MTPGGCLAPLKALNSLTTLELANNEINDVTPLKDLSSLGYLNLSGNAIDDLSPLKNVIAGMVEEDTIGLFFTHFIHHSPPHTYWVRWIRWA